MKCKHIMLFLCDVVSRGYLLPSYTPGPRYPGFLSTTFRNNFKINPAFKKTLYVGVTMKRMRSSNVNQILQTSST